MFPLGLPGLSLPFPGRDVPYLLFWFFKVPFHGWEKIPNFNPSKFSVNCPRLVNYKSFLLSEAQEMADNAHAAQEFEKFLLTSLFCPSGL